MLIPIPAFNYIHVSGSAVILTIAQIYFFGFVGAALFSIVAFWKYGRRSMELREKIFGTAVTIISWPLFLPFSAHLYEEDIKERKERIDDLEKEIEELKKPKRGRRPK